jgi:NAD(P)-dependent dehydrogenase (short-subunit alcohol dehydrogenase family)
MAGSLEGKVILVAGGGNGSGRACALAYADAGAAVAIGDIDLQAAESVRDAIVGAGGSASIHHFDNDDTASVTALVEAVLREHGRLSGLHCVAGNPTLHERDLDLLASDPSVWQDTFRNHFIAYAVAAKVAIPAMIANGGGSIINTSSGQAIAADTTRLGYQVSKRGAELLSLHIARTYGAQGIRCNVLRYGVILSENAKARLSADFIEQARERTWLARVGEPQDAVGAALFLMSDAASFISGQIIEVAGGKMVGIQG